MSIEEHIRETFEQATDDIHRTLDARLRELVEHLSQAAATERETALRELRDAHEVELAQRVHEAASQAMATGGAELSRRLEDAAASARLETSKRVDEAVAAARAEGARHVEDAIALARSEADRRIEEAVAAAHAEAERKLNETIVRLHAEAEQRVAEARAEDARNAENAAATARSEANRRIEDAVAAAHAEGARKLDEAVARVQAETEQRITDAVSAADTEHATALAKEGARHASLLASSVVEARAATRQAQLADTERLCQAIRGLDGASTLTDVLDSLVEATAAVAPRAAVLLVHSGRIQGWRLLGFTPAVEARSIDVQIEQAGLLACAVKSGQSCATTDQLGRPVAAPDLTFASLAPDRVGLAVPVQVGGEAVAVVYADDGGVAAPDVPSAWPEAVEILARHAARCLEVLTVARVSHLAAAPHETRAIRSVPPTSARPLQPAAASDDDDEAARRYARLLVSEIKLYHETAVNQGRREHDLLTRLGAEIERARRLYEERVPATVRLRADYFGEELVRTLANGDASLLGTATTRT